ncbi:Heparan-Alpha-Glucosaminide N-Acetyltransferase [Manis pentadactyla]|nr:Heparan-Alpha-Glucosaminide N-Acetyltransferase [Manis pentadactyla]
MIFNWPQQMCWHCLQSGGQNVPETEAAKPASLSFGARVTSQEQPAPASRKPSVTALNRIAGIMAEE